MTKSRKLWLCVFVLLVLLIVLITVKYNRAKKNDPYATFIKPRLEMSVFRITRITKNTTFMEVKMLIDNPVPVGITLDDFSYSFLIGGTEVIKSNYPESIHVKANDSGYVTFPVEINNRQLMVALEKMKMQKYDSTDYQVNIKTHIAFPGIKNKEFEFNLSKRLPVFIVPEIKIRDVDFQKLGLKHTVTNITLDIVNPCAVKYKFKSVNYKVSIDSGDLTSGSITDDIIIPAFGKTSVDVPVDLRLGKGVKTVFDNWFRASSTTYKVYMDAMIIADDNFIKDSKVILESEGTLKEIKELRKGGDK